MAKTAKTKTAGLPAFSIVIPANNEADNIRPLVTEIETALKDEPRFELIFVNDGSTDETKSVLKKLAAKRPWLREIRHRIACGKAAAVRSGVRAARAPLIVILDGDGQNDPIYIPAMLAAFDQGNERVGLVNSVRVGRKDTRFKRFQSRIANRIRAALLKDETRDTASGLKAFRRDVYLALPFFDGLHRFLPALVRREGFDLVQVDVVDRPRLHGSTHYGFWNRFWVGILDLAGVWWLIRRRKHVPEIVDD
jgi:glycosyltransferase involved in cell wall biosynthesis